MTDPLPQVEALLAEAKTFFAQRNAKKAADRLHAAHLTASQLGLHREASLLKRAMTILASGGKPKLLSPYGSLSSE